MTTGGVAIQEFRFDHIHRPSSPNLSHLDTQSLASTTSTTLYHAESVEDTDMQMGIKCKSCELSSGQPRFTLLSLHSHHPTVSF